MDPNLEARLGPAERIIQTVLSQGESHMVHARPGIVNADASTPIGYRWRYVTHKVENGEKVVFAIGRDPQTKRETKTRLGILGEDGEVRELGAVVGSYRSPGIFREVAAWLYRQVAEVWKIDNEFAARWASYAFVEEHRDLKVVLAAFMLCQSRKGDPVREGDAVVFRDDDFRAVGEAMALLTRKDGRDFSPKLLRRVLAVLWCDEVAAVNRELGFARGVRAPFLGRWEHAARMYLRYREENPKMLEGLVKAGFRTTVIDLVGLCRYRPATPRFFALLRYKQKQAADGHRNIQIGAEVSAAESWADLDERAVCERISSSKVDFKRIESLLATSKVGLTRAVMTAAIESGALSNKDLIMRTPTLEDLGLMTVQSVKERWERALREADDMRAANVALRVRSKSAKDALQTAAEDASKKAVEEVVRAMRIYVVVDVSGSMQPAIEAAKAHLARLLPAFPLDRLHVSIFNTVGRVVEIKHASAAGVENAFRGIVAQGGTNHAAGVSVFANAKPKPDEDALFIFVGDQQDNAPSFADAFARIGFRPNAFGFVKVVGTDGDSRRPIENTATQLGIPCFVIDERTFADPYAVPRTIRNLIASTPVTARAGAAVQRRETLVEKILKTPLLARPAWVS